MCVLFVLLLGRENYSTWQFAVQTYLEHECLLKCINGTETDVAKISKAKTKIILLLDPVNYVHVQDCTNAEQVWNKLKSAFDDSGLCRRVSLLRTLTTTKLDDCSSMMEYVNIIVSTAQKLNGIGLKVDDEWVGTLLLAGLPEYYGPMIMGIASTKTNITGDFIKTKLLQDIKATKFSENNSAFVSQNSHFHKNNSNNLKGIRCFSCSSYGHKASSCSRQMANKKNPAKSKMSTTPNANGVHTAVFSTNTIDNDNWYVDSGASAHYTMRDDWLEENKEAQMKEIIVANSAKLKVESTGKVNVNIAHGGTSTVIPINNVQYVPDLSANLLSVSQLVNKGFSVTFDRQGCRIIDNAGDVCETASMVNNMFKLDLDNSVNNSCLLTKVNDENELWYRNLDQQRQSIELEPLPTVELFNELVGSTLVNYGHVNMQSSDGLVTETKFTSSKNAKSMEKAFVGNCCETKCVVKSRNGVLLESELISMNCDNQICVSDNNEKVVLNFEEKVGQKATNLVDNSHLSNASDPSGPSGTLPTVVEQNGHSSSESDEEKYFTDDTSEPEINDNVFLRESMGDPMTVNDMDSPDSDLWRKTMEDECNSLQVNQTLDLTDLPQDRNAMGVWILKLESTLKNIGFNQSTVDPCVYVKIRGKSTNVMAAYVDDLSLISNDAKYCIDFHVTRDRIKGELRLDPEKHIRELLEKFNLIDSNIIVTPVNSYRIKVKSYVNQCVALYAKFLQVERSKLMRVFIPLEVYYVLIIEHWMAVLSTNRSLKGTLNVKCEDSKYGNQEALELRQFKQESMMDNHSSYKAFGYPSSSYSSVHRRWSDYDFNKCVLTIDFGHTDETLI